MLRLLIDQDLDHVILRGLRFAFQTQMSSPLTRWASVMRLIPIFSHGRRSRSALLSPMIAHHVLSRCSSYRERRESVAGVIIVSRRLPVSQVIDDLEIIITCSDMGEWENIIKHLPL
jgi:hypothetical protein